MLIQTKTLACGAIMAVALSACGGSEGGSSSQNDEKAASYAIEIQEVEARQDTCKGDDCAYATFHIPQLSGGLDEVRDVINTDIEVLVRENIKARLPEPMAQGTFKALAESFVEGYELFQMEFPDHNTPWFFEIDGRGSVLSQQYFVLKLEVHDYMGGAHGNIYTLLQNYSLSDGGLVDVRQLYDEDALKVLAEAAFREKQGLSKEASLNDEGYMFPDGMFALPENMALTDSGLVLLYNPYEVAAYAQGATELLLPLPEDTSIQ